MSLELLRELIGWPALLGNFSANIAEPGNEGGAVHADQLFIPTPWPADPQGMNFTWLLDDFTVESAVPLIAPAGTVVALESRVWHRTGSNRSDHPRAAAFARYTKPIYRTRENWFLALDDEVLEAASDNLLTLLGYRTKGLDLVYGSSPR